MLSSWSCHTSESLPQDQLDIIVISTDTVQPRIWIFLLSVWDQSSLSLGSKHECIIIPVISCTFFFNYHKLSACRLKWDLCISEPWPIWNIRGCEFACDCKAAEPCHTVSALTAITHILFNWIFSREDSSWAVAYNPKVQRKQPVTITHRAPARSPVQ